MQESLYPHVPDLDWFNMTNSELDSCYDLLTMPARFAPPVSDLLSEL